MSNVPDSERIVQFPVERACRVCAAALPLDADHFGMSSGRYHFVCRTCTAARERARYWANPSAGRELARKRALERHHADPVTRNAERMARYYARRERDIAGARAKDWIKGERRRLGQPPAEAIAYVARLFRDPCAYCGRFSEPPTIDHIVPVSQGGSSQIDNLTACCNQCNARKGQLPLFVFLSRLHAGPLAEELR